MDKLWQKWGPAISSLSCWAEGQYRGHVYMLTGGCFSQHKLRNGVLEAGNSADGERFMSGLCSFIDEKLAEPGCLGLIPLDEEATTLLEEHGAALLEQGIAFNGTPGYRVYGRIQ